MNNENALQELLVSNIDVEVAENILNENLKDLAKRNLKNTLYSAYKEECSLESILNLLLEDTTDLQLKSFYLGVDYALNLLGRDGIIDFLPKEIKAGLKHE